MIHRSSVRQTCLVACPVTKVDEITRGPAVAHLVLGLAPSSPTRVSLKSVDNPESPKGVDELNPFGQGSPARKTATHFLQDDWRLA